MGTERNSSNPSSSSCAPAPTLANKCLFIRSRSDSSLMVGMSTWKALPRKPYPLVGIKRKWIHACTMPEP
eukprot:6000607-Amphidinium_carterae.1